MARTNSHLPIDEVFLGLPDGGVPTVELPLSRGAFWIVVGAALITLLLMGGRVFFLGVARADYYSERALANAHKSTVIAAPRGIILDRYGKEIVSNRSSFSVRLSLYSLRKDLHLYEATLARLAETLEIPLDSMRDYLRTIPTEVPTAKIAEDISLRQAITLQDLDLDGVQVVSDYARNYLHTEAFSHVVGYGEKAGIEGQYNEVLRGIDGEEIEYRDAKGEVLGQRELTPPKSGDDLTTTLDADLSLYLYERMKKALKDLGREAGVGLAMNPQTGEILALTSFPSFNTGNIVPFLKGAGQPLFNRAISGVYTPGSTLKVLHGLAALREKIVTPDFSVYSDGTIEIPNPFDATKPGKFLDWKAHGWVDLKSALAKSSNIYFYAIGGGLPKQTYTFGPIPPYLGIATLKKYWQFFGLGVPTGIDIPGENAGFLPDAETKEKRTGSPWRVGDTYNVSIGQGDVQLTPLQLLSFISSVANGGKVETPYVVPHEGVPATRVDYSAWTSELAAVREGMFDAVEASYGTARLLNTLPIRVAGKTGSSQVANNTRTNAFFVGYGPTSTNFAGDFTMPQIAILILIENSKEGSLNTIPVAYDIFNWYYTHRLASSTNDAVESPSSP